MSQSDFIKTFLTGAVSGSISTILYQPLDVLKTQLQSSTKRDKNLSIGYAQVSRAIVRNDGICGFWKGLTPALGRCIPGVGLYFSTLHFLSQFVRKDPSNVETVLMGAVARTSSTVIVIPMTLLKTRFESGEYKYGGLFHALQTVKQKEGLRGFTQGLLPTILRDVPFSGLYYLFYTRLKTFVGIESAEPNFSFKIFFTGMVAGCLACVITHPADVIKTYMQLYPKEFTRFYSGIRFVYLKFGSRGYFNGLLVRVFRRALVTSTSWTVYEKVILYVNLVS